MTIKVCIAGATGWTGSVVARHLLASDDFDVVGAIARQSAGRDLGEVLGLAPNGVIIHGTLDEVCAGGVQPDVLIDYTDPASVKPRTFEALARGIRVVIGGPGWRQPSTRSEFGGSPTGQRCADRRPRPRPRRSGRHAALAARDREKTGAQIGTAGYRPAASRSRNHSSDMVGKAGTACHRRSRVTSPTIEIVAACTSSPISGPTKVAPTTTERAWSITS